MRNFFMRYYSIILFSCLLLVSLAIEYIGPNAQHAFMQPYVPALHSQDKAGSSHGHATIIILDMSGSMITSDPNGYRCSAADSYIDLSGVNDYIGLVGLDNNSGATTGGSHNFLSAQTWSEPQPTETKQDKDKLKQAIVENSTKQSRFCSPDGNTPTYDSLDRAYQMLTTVTSQHHVSGSVILLTDGVPCPDVDKQITAIQNELLHKFRDSGWPVDTIGLGEDASIASISGCSVPGTLSGTFHGFLSNIANSTGGTPYDDSHGPVAGVSALNIAPFFAEILSKYSGKTLHKDILPTQLSGETQRRNFTVVDGTTKLDVLVVRDNLNMQVSLSNPQNQPITARDAGVLAPPDNYSVIYSISDPVPGPWILSVRGPGQYLMDDFQQTNIGLQVDRVQLQGSNFAAPKPLPLGKPIVVTAHLTTNGQLLSSGNYAVTGYVSYNGTSDDCSQAPAQSPVSFNLSNSAGTYVGTFTIPDTASAGAYDILLCASIGSAQNTFASLNSSVRMELFPTPYLISPTTQLPTDTAVSTTVIRWPRVLSELYSLPWISVLSEWPLQGTPAQPETNGLLAELQWKGQLYANATIQSPATVSYGNRKSVAATVINKGQGKFLVQFVPLSDGPYTIALQTSGTYKDSYGEFGPPTTRVVNITIKDASFDWQLRAYGITLLYLVMLVFLICLIRFSLLAPPFGAWRLESSADGTAGGHRQFRSGQRSLIQAFFRRDEISSQKVGLNSGLRFRFKHQNIIMVKPVGGGKRWFRSNGQPLPGGYSVVNGVRYQSTATDASDENSKAYHIISEISQNTRNQGCFLGVVLGVLAIAIFLVGLLLHNPVLILIGLVVAPLAVSQGLPAALSTPVQRKPTHRPTAPKRHRTNPPGRRGRR